MTRTVRVRQSDGGCGGRHGMKSEAAMTAATEDEDRKSQR